MAAVGVVGIADLPEVVNRYLKKDLACRCVVKTFRGVTMREG
jgi:hypothetical protein